MCARLTHLGSTPFFKQKMTQFFKLFPKHSMSIIGMIHVRPLPGTPQSSKFFSINQLIEKACSEASIYLKYGIHGLLIENMFDRPYIKSLPGPEIAATMTRVCSEVRRIVPNTIPCGCQILAGLNHEALAVALASELQFIRVEGFVFSHVADEGLMMDACAGPLLRYRKQIDAEHVCILADLKKKHCSHSITADVDLVQTCEAAAFFLADGVILTGQKTGDAPCWSEVTGLCATTHSLDMPLVIGSGVTDKNLDQLFRCGIDVAIVGSYFKQNGRWQNDLCEQRIQGFMKEWRHQQKVHRIEQRRG